MNNQEFTAFINDSLNSGVVDEETLAHSVSTNRSSIRRWKDGRNSPHPAMFPGIVGFIHRAGRNNSETSSLLNSRKTFTVHEETFCRHFNITPIELGDWRRGQNLPDQFTRGRIWGFLETNFDDLR